MAVQEENAAGFSIVSHAEQPEAFAAILSGTSLHSEHLYYARYPYSGLEGVENVAALTSDNQVENLSFHVCRGRKRLATVPLSVQGDRVAGWHAVMTNYAPLPARMHLAPDCDNPARTIAFALRYLSSVAARYGLWQIVLEEPMPDGMLAYKALSAAHMFSAEIWDRPVVDLRQPEDKIHARVRSSYKSLISWGRQNLVTEYFSGKQLDDATASKLYYVLQECHEKIIALRGDQMPYKCFQLAMAMCRHGKGEAAIAKMPNGDECAIAVTIDNDDGSSFYALGGQVEVANKSPGNFIMYDAIVRAKQRGRLRYRTNTLSATPVQITGRNIVLRPEWQRTNFFFKRGFSDDIEIAHVYRIWSGIVAGPG